MRRELIFVALGMALSTASFAALFTEDFDTDNTANWTVNQSSFVAVSSANFFFDYSSVGIPSAPNSVGGTTLGLRLDANTSPASPLFSGQSVSPNGQAFSGNYRLSADVWLNFVGPAPLGGSGSTQCGGLGIGTAGVTPQWAGGVQDSVWFAATGDGNSSVDYRAYSSAAGTGYPDASPVFAAGAVAGNRQESNPYYAGFGGITPPVAQATLFPNQIGTTKVGAQGFAWHRYVVEKVGDTISWYIDGLLIATIDATTVTFGGSNILLNYFDTNTTASTDTTAMNFGLFDNIKVEEITQSATVNGTVTLNNSDGDWSNEAVTIEIVDPNTSNTVETLSGVALGTTGAYSAATTVPAGTYDVYIKGDTFLRKLTAGVVFTASGATVNATLINGDVDGDNEVAPNDFSILSGAFGNVQGDPGYSAAADLDDDGEVGPSDFSILSGAFGQSGD